MSDTIFALSSGASPAAIAVVRISGPMAHEALERLAGELPPARTLALRTIRDPDTGEVLDRALVAQFPAEASVTGEALAELHLHGGRATVDAVLGTLSCMAGLRGAKPGEFTWRAFANGKMNLVEVESLSDMLRAETQAQRRAALAEAGLGTQVERWRLDVLQLSAEVEAALDQSDEDDVPAHRRDIEALGARIAGEMGALLARPGAERLFDGVRVVFAGPPNAGKSTLINSLAQREVAIVSPIAGTTRDVIEAPVMLDGIALVLTDTAGLRDATGDAIEREGVARANRRIAGADLVVWMADSAPPSDLPEERVIAIHARSDALERGSRPSGRLPVSALTGEGIPDLIRMLVDRSRALLPHEGDVALTRRQRACLTQCHDAIQASLADADELIAAEHLRAARMALDELTGRAGTEDMLDALFGTFCVGK